MPDPRWFQIMTNLLYPAVLGSLAYSFAQQSLPSASMRDPLFVGGCALLVLFVMDYAHSLRDDVRQAYDGWKFVADFVVVFGLFLAGTAVLKNPTFPAVPYVWWLLMAKAAAVGWELAESHRRPSSRAAAAASRRFRFFGLETDLALLVTYAVLALLSISGVSGWPWAAAVAMGVDAWQYFRYIKLEKSDSTANAQR